MLWGWSSYKSGCSIFAAVLSSRRWALAPRTNRLPQPGGNITTQCSACLPARTKYRIRARCYSGRMHSSRQVIHKQMARQIATLIQRIKSHLFLGILLAIVCFTNMGCEFLAESTFKLADESRLPKWVTLPPRLTRPNISLTLSYYSIPWVGNARFTLRDKNQQIIEKYIGRTICKRPFQVKSLPQGFPSGYPNYQVVTVNGITEIMEQKKPEPSFM